MLTNNLLMESAHGYSSIGVDAALLSQRKIFMTEKVDDDSCRALIQQLIYFDSQNQDEEIVMYINSPGGFVSSGLAVYDTMRMLKSPIRTVCIGTAASMGAILFLGADRREMLPHSQIMIHDPSYGGGGYAGKKPHEIQKEVDELNKIREQTCKIIAERTGHPIKEIYKKTAVDSYFGVQEAIDFGLATGAAENL
ncbi:MAG: ATP-dependent Clp protease proteolytic subunit [Oscillospiraceae bacterium]|nr:ATP-dependent Clp protease proteolytic subunit [Oscillospiraceae bacterium]